MLSLTDILSQAGVDVAGLNALIAQLTARYTPATSFLTQHIQVKTTPTPVASANPQRLGFAISMTGAGGNIYVASNNRLPSNPPAVIATVSQGEAGFWLPTNGASGGLIWVFGRDDQYTGPIFMTASTSLFIATLELMP